MPAPKAHDWIMDLNAYVPGRAHVHGIKEPVKLSANESAFGPSPKAVDAVKAAAGRVMRYPDPASAELRDAIADVHGLKAANIICGAGSDEGLTLLIHTYAGPGDEVIFSQYGFMVYPIQTQAAGAVGVAVPNKNWAADVDGILAAVTERTKIVIIDNPNNPTGAYLPWSEVERLHAGLPDHVLLVLDAAYAECVTASDYEAGEALVEASENVVMTRTFSKMYALAALRVGWLYAPHAVIDALNRWRMPFNVCLSGQVAALAAVGDQKHLDAAVRHNNEWRDWMTAQLSALGLDVVPSETNFVLVEFPDESPFTALECNEYLTRNGYLVRALPSLPKHLRISVGTDEQNRTVMALISGFMNGSQEGRT
ncbi:histidinol-phosphate transaminase [Kordiimonas aestuarii]|uniref:histidinol-phosphate transaminase n=1 Tax=Kordiimonas aestuarii TaxID=1005925 RepID=UPI0021D20309|nr:histidinol-phosphate transaminase [Kordiimonas aestuarii]